MRESPFSRFFKVNELGFMPTKAGVQVFLLLSSIAGIFFFTHFVERYLDIFNQVVVGWVALASILVLNRAERFKEPPWRFVFLLLAGLISLRYFVWRTLDTLIYTGPIDLIGLTLLYLAEVYALSIHFLGIFVNLWPVRREPVPLPDDPSALPTVDIFIPTFNEPEEIVRITVTAATQIDYPADRMRIYLLDDGGTVARRGNPKLSRTAWERHISFRAMAEELGVTYLTREINEHAKAGNINNALNHSNGELILILDCDHVPTRDILKNTVGAFLRDRRLFLVQTPHFFINPAPLEKNLAGVSKVPDENDMFYRAVQLGLDFWNSSYFCGSAAILRREYLAGIGGISGDTVTEDAETSLILHSKGYNSLYINKPMVCGLSPETFDDYIIQRTRWAQGMIQILILKNPIMSKGLSFSQRLCYLNSCFFWFFGIPRSIFYIAPAMVLLFGLKIYHASLMQVIAYALPHVLSAFIVTDFLYGKVRRPFFSELYESIQSIFLIPAVLSVLINPRGFTFKITPKGKKLEIDFLNPMASVFFLVVLTNLIAVPMALIKWINYPLYRDTIIINFSWCLFNIFLGLASLGAFWEKKQVRHYHRAWARGPIDIFFPRLKRMVRGEIKDISLTGVGIEAALPFSVEPREEVVLEACDSYGERYKFGARVQRQIKSGDITLCGAEFILDKDTYARLVRFVYGDSMRWSDLWEEKTRPAGVLREISHLIYMGVKGSRVSFLYLGQTIFSIVKKQLDGLLIAVKAGYQRLERIKA